MKPFRCRICERPITSPYGLCRACINYKYTDLPTVVKSISKKQRFDKAGNPICIICGKVTESISRHIRIHNMTIDEYRKKFNIPKKIVLHKPKEFNLSEEDRKLRSERMKKYNEKRLKNT